VPARANSEWQRWGETDPLFGVSSWAGKRATDQEPWTDDAFYQMGESDWQDFLTQWRQYGCRPGVCLEIGCGAARLTRAMAGYFEHVHGIDVAPGMLAKAAPAVEGLGVTLHLNDGLSIPLDTESVDAVFSAHVFQHFDSIEDARANWREITRVLRPQGTLMIHLPVHIWPEGLAPLEGAYAGWRVLGSWRAAIRRRRMLRSGGVPSFMRRQSYSWSNLDALLKSLGFANIELRVFRVASDSGRHSVVLARKST
jgi:SAM-dependent methyltransferase